jgi:hypothetical protein
LSKNRDLQKETQIYELNLDHFRERRLTYQDGNCFDAEYTPDGRHILYSSNTDEIKENPPLLHPRKPSDRPQTEIYLRDLEGDEIQRLTFQDGYQGQLSFIRNDEILLASEKGPRLQIMKLGWKTNKAAISLWKSDDKASLELPTLDPSGTLVTWLIRDDASAKLKLGLKMKGHVQPPLDLPFAQVQSLQWIQGPKKKTYSSGECQSFWGHIDENLDSGSDREMRFGLLSG